MGARAGIQGLLRHGIIAGLCVLVIGRRADAQCESDIAAPGSSILGARDQCGSVIAIGGARCIVGAPFHDAEVPPTGSDTGAAVVFTISDGAFVSPVRLLAADRAPDDRFGAAVALDASGTTAIVGAPFDNHAAGADAGSVYVFARTASIWSQQTKIVAPDGAGADSFGASVAVSPDGQWAAVGVPRDDLDAGVNAGSVWVLRRNGAAWTGLQRLEAPDAAPADRFGNAVAMDEDRIVVGSLLDDDRGAESGAAYIFVRSGTVWSFEAKLTAPDGAPADQFGSSVSLAAGRIAVGAWLNDLSGVDAGAAYVFTRTDETWVLEERLAGQTLHAGDLFGVSIAISGQDALGTRSVVVGGKWSDTGAPARLNAGAIHLFRQSSVGEMWTWARSIQRHSAAADEELGAAAAIAGDGAALVAGVPFLDTDAGVDAGGAALFLLNGPDCNGDRICNRREILLGLACDTNANLVPDPCEPDPVGDPVISTGPQPIEVAAGATAMFGVTAIGNPIIRYRWRKDGMDLVNDGRVSGADSTVLTISNTSCTDAGAYTVRITDRCGETTSPDASLHVLPPMPVVIPTTLTAPAHTPAVLTATMMGSGIVAHEWRRNGAILVNGGRIQGATTSQLTVLDARCEDSGQYTVRVATACGMYDSPPVTVTVESPADWDASGSVDSQDYFEFLGSLFDGMGDFNRDGRGDSQDFFEFLDVFFEGC